MEPTNFSWFIDGKIAALGFPSSHTDVEFLCKIGVKQLISLTETPPCLYGMKLTQVHIPIDDMTAPSIQQVNEFLRVVELAHLKGEVNHLGHESCAQEGILLCHSRNNNTHILTLMVRVLPWKWLDANSFH